MLKYMGNFKPGFTVIYVLLSENANDHRSIEVDRYLYGKTNGKSKLTVMAR